MPYLKNGNCRDYIKQHPNADRLHIVRGFGMPVLSKYDLKPTQLYDISLGLVHLHSHQIVHGDLKGVGKLMDYNMRALLTNF